MFHPFSSIVNPIRLPFEVQIDQDMLLLSRNQGLPWDRFIDASIIPSQHWENLFSKRIQTISSKIRKNLDKTNQIISLLDRLYKDFQLIEEQFNSIVHESESQEKESLSHTYTQESDSFEGAVINKVQNNRTHPKIKLMENVFGKKKYYYKLSYDGKFPKVLFKQRNISFKILLKNMMSEPVINGNQISLHLKVFKNNGEEIVSDNPDQSLMQGLCQTKIRNGVGIFSKIHPRQVSRGFSGKGICIIIYATSQQNQTNQLGLRIQASQIQPLIFYNVKVVVKQNKFTLKNQKQTALQISDQS